MCVWNFSKQNFGKKKQYALWCCSLTHPLEIYWEADRDYSPKKSLHSVQFSSITQLCSSLCDPMDCSTPGFPVYHQLPEFTQTHVHWVSDAIQPPHHLSSPSPPALNLSQHQGLLKWVSSSHQVAKVLEFQLQHQAFQRIFRTDFFRMDWLDLLAVQGRRRQRHPTPVLLPRKSHGWRSLVGCSPWGRKVGHD